MAKLEFYIRVDEFKHFFLVSNLMKHAKKLKYSQYIVQRENDAELTINFLQFFFFETG